MEKHGLSQLWTNVSNNFRAIRVPIKGPKKLTSLKWQSSKFEKSQLALSSSKKRLQISLNNKHENKFYLIQNGSPKSFNKIEKKHGLAAREINDVEFTLKGSNSNTLLCELFILEFNSNRERINLTSTRINQPLKFAAKQEAEYALIGISLKGEGTASISGLEINTIEVMPEASSYVWKRRALAWEQTHKRELTKNQFGAASLSEELLCCLAETLPDSNGSQYHEKINMQVGIITDIYMYNFYKDVFQGLHYLTPENYLDIIENKNLDAILYTSCWKGIDEEEWRGVKFRQRPQSALDEIIKLAQAKNIQLIFQSIEDPSNFEYFLPIAKKFDHIFTSDTNCIRKYKEECGHERVYYGEYGVNPLINNPIACRRHIINAYFFAGSYPTRYAERCSDMHVVFDSIKSSNGKLIIADRNHGAEDPKVKYPEHYTGHLIPPIDHLLLQKTHKLFRFNLNFNSIKDSPSMCAMRAYELQAQGCGIISNYANSIFNKFPGIRIIPFRQNLSLEVCQPEETEEFRQNMSNLRSVMTDKTSYDVVQKMLANCGINVPQFKTPKICVLFDRLDHNIQKCFDAQEHPEKILKSVHDFKSEDNWPTFSTQEGIKYFTWFSDKNDYERYYLTDMLNAFKYTNSCYVTKNAHYSDNNYIEGPTHEFTSFCRSKAQTLFSAKTFTPSDFSKYSLSCEINELKNGYSIDPFEMNYVRYTSQHTQSAPPCKLTVIVPTYNNGKFLTSKCIPSLRRNYCWPDIQVLLIDDGSTDRLTKNTCKQLSKQYDNIETYFFEEGGSGSASRPRNKGIELANTPLISFLDPDNEISPGGYDNLLDIYHEHAAENKKKLSFVSGYHVKVNDEAAKPVAKHTSHKVSIAKSFEETYFKKGRFPTISTQAAVISRDVFKSENMRFIEQAAGQDTLFGWELLVHAHKGAFTNSAYIIYYSERENSVTNSVDRKYFEKKLILEKEQVKMLKRNNILSEYKRHHFVNFMNNWYLPKLSKVDDRNKNDCIEILNQISSLYNEAKPNFELEARAQETVVDTP